jgi:murein DD-endopeptidase MepM/ murein hydrolase activator NlpD
MKDIKTSKPVDKPKITSNFGWRILNNKKQFHDGIDFVSEDGNTYVYSIFDGKVVYDFDNYIHAMRFSDPRHSGGNYVIIQNFLEGEYFFIKYLHLKENYVSLNEDVKAGQKIGIYADVGFSFGSHLHITIYNYKWKIINPNTILKKYEII